ncbi:hypothetical protein [Novosphingobium sp.]|uniref:hypothetical protein n=1 Tax=Novosphingobium sp. TaxID=1874826 RepID=UPI001DB36D66|nr:hypothetical protein [Novosphingobium sp.]MBX9662960.1 hypothetical protein [Novosphingobium sp.]
MRLLLVLLALLSGLSLSEVAATSARSEMIGAAAGTLLVASQERKAEVGLAKAQRPACEQRPVRTIVLPVLAFIRAITISIWDRPLE